MLHVHVRGRIWPFYTSGVPLSCSQTLCAFSARFSSNSRRRRLLVTDSAYPERRSLVARLLLVTGSHVHVLCCTVSFSSRRRQRTLQFSPNHVGNSLAARPSRLHLSLYRVRLLYRVQLSPVKAPIHAIKSFFPRTPRRPTRSSLFLFLSSHFANF